MSSVAFKESHQFAPDPLKIPQSKRIYPFYPPYRCTKPRDFSRQFRVTVVECINAFGWALPPCAIFKGKVFLESWFDGLPDDCQFEVSPNGLTSDQIGLRWLEKLFIPSTPSRTKGGGLLALNTRRLRNRLVEMKMRNGINYIDKN
ncbi:DDE superfamily endonuclease, CENP-B-like [Penicillium camemberti]|uniref:DDE superfamily endonuclease, CENP-B-like n=1 Tax=Penicillium camemberti (strain FM 013) TaxID=1429867 RepID=A0A0G4PV59_PENC3|nr:DDE superfamily endonuclease, CENP-B-like [Penicillium camemberti]